MYTGAARILYKSIWKHSSTLGIFGGSTLPFSNSVWRRSITTTNWHESEIITDRKSKFQARHVELYNADDIPGILEHFLSSHKSIAKNASHPHMIAWRIGEPTTKESISVPSTKEKKSKKHKPSGVPSPPLTYTNIQIGSRDNGESGAGSCLLQVLETNNFMNVLVIVTRWYGGNPIGGLRFRHINRVAINSLKMRNE